MQDQPARAAIYCRISQVRAKDRERDVPKVQVQEARCRKLAKEHGYVVTAPAYVDEGVSATSGKTRDAWERLLADVEAGKFDILLAYEEERFARGSFDKERLLKACAKQGVKWHTVRQNLIDPSTAYGRFQSGLMALVAEFEIGTKVERGSKETDRRRAERLPILGPRVFGYEKDRVTHRPREAQAIREGYDSVLAEGSLYAVMKRWHAQGIKTARADAGGDSTGRWSLQSVRQVLMRPRNAALMLVDGELVQGAWEGIVTKEQWENLCDVLNQADRRSTGANFQDHRERRWLLSGIAICGGCGARMRTATTKSRGKAWPNYRCSTKLGIPADNAVHSSIHAERLDEHVANAVAMALLAGSQSEADRHDPDLVKLRQLRVERAEVRGQIEAAARLAIEGGSTIARETAGRMLSELEERERQLDASVTKLMQQSTTAAILAGTKAELFKRGERVDLAEVAELRRQIAERFQCLDIGRRRALVRDLMTVTVDRGRGMDRVRIEHLAVPSLSEDDEMAAV